MLVNGNEPKFVEGILSTVMAFCPYLRISGTAAWQAIIKPAIKSCPKLILPKSIQARNRKAYVNIMGTTFFLASFLICFFTQPPNAKFKLDAITTSQIAY